VNKSSIFGAIALAAIIIATSSIFNKDFAEIMIAGAIIIPIIFILGIANPRESYREIIFVIAVVWLHSLNLFFEAYLFWVWTEALVLLFVYILLRKNDRKKMATA
jgi:hypothetical protein